MCKQLPRAWYIGSRCARCTLHRPATCCCIPQTNHRFGGQQHSRPCSPSTQLQRAPRLRASPTDSESRAPRLYKTASTITACPSVLARALAAWSACFCRCAPVNLHLHVDTRCTPAPRTNQAPTLLCHGARALPRRSLVHWGARRVYLRAALDSEAPSRHRPEEPDHRRSEGAANGVYASHDVPTPSSNQEEVERWLQELGMSEVGTHTNSSGTSSQHIGTGNTRLGSHRHPRAL